MRCSGIVPGREDAPSCRQVDAPHVEHEAELVSDQELSDSPSSHSQGKNDEKSSPWSDFVVRVRKHLRKKADKEPYPGSSGQISIPSPKSDNASHFLKELETFPDANRDCERSDPLDLSARSESDCAEGSDSWAESDSVFMSKEFIKRNFAVDTKLMGHKTPEPPEPASEPVVETSDSQERSVAGHQDVSFKDVLNRIRSFRQEKEKPQVDEVCDDTETPLPSAPELEDLSPQKKSSVEGDRDEESSSPLDLSKQASSESLADPEPWTDSPTESALEEHHLQEERSESQRHLCGLCEREFYEKAGLDEHVCADIDEKPFSCDFCGNSFSMKSSLKVHVSLHTGRKPHCCNTCGKSFLYGSILKRHMLRHTAEEPQGCSICLESFASMLELEDHMVAHYEEKTQPCDVQDGPRKPEINNENCVSGEDARSDVSSGDAPTKGSCFVKHEFLPTEEDHPQCAINRGDGLERIAG